MKAWNACMWVFVLYPYIRFISCKWVYEVKTRFDGFLERYKVCLVARGFQHEHGRDYDEIFAPVAHMTTIHSLLAVTSVTLTISILVGGSFPAV
ncbi:Putative RING zinc finger domain superfamily protein [Zea mays]|jgi:hypothetical protein|uniref:Putative RING zinc finger domain superfamily protein n=1 Tax=Zea mays TaxID=4577 RepID=A0A1D6M348_MAIZE|nr:Putative RING zinc finger domain superfamily protein [Zea mays]